MYSLYQSSFASSLNHLSLALIMVFTLAACDSSDALDEPQPQNDLVDTAIAANFNTLVAAVQAADLVETLKSDGPFTVFAPTDEAFAKLPEGTVESLLMPENKDQLAAILTYHVIPGRVLAADVVGLTSAQTAQGASVTFSVSGEEVMINNAKITAVDVEASNGIIHVIDSVILPPSN